MPIGIGQMCPKADFALGPEISLRGPDPTYCILFHTFLCSNGMLGETNETTESGVKLKTEGGRERRIQSLKRNKWLRDKYHIDVNTESLDLEKPKNRRSKNIEEADGNANAKRSFSFGSKKQKNKDQNAFDEATERRNSKRLRESIRKKYNLPTPENSRNVDSTRRR